ncbi:gliding motility-associated protein GldL [Parabacteroides sp. PF5-5]|uniref:type IX secretion system motor protein PorL/GldL n=1 Tax=unclassified Parabacteroides TaxID=2649774 RepID=UPI0024752F44|nr:MULTISPECIES: gliding motility protein GldL [unclassified Parabacteroides]MDH6304989.1 gliding motility-associated protein GldL [Parabacteroides sp. PH5-39]MDH6315926.1 gliding motility-associated protein GldL [Parabacteroides sp. PF5-13]MDH6319583.1 gliding motility-associated protein GldL [Parabacteroides sp. PH5-13]MDH6323314.1 gliding motility-associated protein GldL [Parabacteroides sp. PH5-8]MDH6327178.1 gliding motility-associated protein GldL [Parabacteroides sp. PH5-41]
MGKYRRYKNRVEMYLSSDKGKRLLNFCYSWGASIVILGAMFKILHLPYGNTMLAVGMITEFFVFFIFGFEKPGSDYHWEDVFPVLKSKNPLDRPDFSGSSITSIMHSNANMEDDDTSATPNLSGANINMTGGNGGGGAQRVNLGSMGISPIDVSEEDTKNLSSSIKKLSAAAEQISKMAELTDATQKYLDQLSGMSENMDKFSRVTNSLTDVSDTLLHSYKNITDNSDGITRNSQGYVQQMELLNRNLTGLNTIYEMQLKSISSQINSIEHINAGLNRIKDLYDGSLTDSSVFRTETERMAQQLTQLNQVYSRLLSAMTVNMGPIPQPNLYQQPQQQNPYQQQPQQGNPYQSPYTK